MIDQVVSRARRAALAARLVARTGVLSAVRPLGVARFLSAARASTLGPHLPLMLHASTRPDRECIVDGARRLTWAETDAEVNRLGHALAARGLRRGERVALMLPNGADYLIAQQTLARLGLVAVQIGHKLKPGEVAYILGNAEPRVAIVDRAAAPAMAAAIREAGVDADVIVAGDAEALRGHPADRAARLPRGDGAADAGGAIVYTSGTTGKPKGAARLWSQTGLDAVAEMILRVGVRHDERHLVLCPLYHSAAPAFVAITQMLGGCAVVAERFDAEETLALIARERITSMLVVPTMLVRLTALPAEVRGRYDTSSLRWVVSGAAPLATETARAFQQQFGPILWNFYGSTETGLVTLAGPADHTARPGTIGRALTGNEIRVLDGDGDEVGPGEIGELYVRNSMLIAGYHRNPDATRASMRDGFFSVGDLARYDSDGFYYLESRKHDMVISGGVNIYPREIEDHLHTHPAVLEAAVVGVPDAEWGESLRAFVVVRPGHRLDAGEVIEHCRRTLADYKRPRQVVFLDELPRNPTGKVLKRELRSL